MEGGTPGGTLLDARAAGSDPALVRDPGAREVDDHDHQDGEAP